VFSVLAALGESVAPKDVVTRPIGESAAAKPVLHLIAQKFRDPDTALAERVEHRGAGIVAHDTL
jgi:hypothetical protein